MIAWNVLFPFRDNPSVALFLLIGGFQVAAFVWGVAGFAVRVASIGQAAYGSPPRACRHHGTLFSRTRRPPPIGSDETHTSAIDTIGQSSRD